MKTTVGCLLLLLLLLVFYDAYSTFTIIGKGFATEGNPLIQFMMNNIGVLPALVISKGICFIAICVLYVRLIMSKQISIQKFVVTCSILLVTITCYSYIIYKFNYQNFVGVIY